MFENEILTLEEVAEFLRISDRTVYDWAQKGQIPCGKLGSAWRFKRCEIERWVNERLGRDKRGQIPKAIRLRDVLAPERLIFLETTRKKEALDVLIECLSEAPEIEEPNEFAEAIARREKLMSTGIGLGIAIPHVRLDSVKDLVMAVGLCHAGIPDYVSLDGMTVRIVCIVAARWDQHGEYLKVLSAISSRLKDEEFREKLMAAKDTESAYDILTSADE